jgi:GNAT superfamily N-acetyltransferase
MGALQIEILDRSHALNAFDCGEEQLNKFLLVYALTASRSGQSRTYVALNDIEVIGFYTLVVGEVSYDGAHERMIKGMARHPVPVMVLARMGVAVSYQKRGVGTSLLKHAILRTLDAAKIAGIRAMTVHAKNVTIRSFYENFGFQASPTDPLHLFVLIKDLRGMQTLERTVSENSADRTHGG